MRNALARDAQDAPVRLDRPPVGPAARKRRFRTALTATGAASFVAVAVIAASAWPVPGQGQDRLQPAQAVQAPFVGAACAEPPPVPVDESGALPTDQRGPGMPQRAWDAVVTEAPVAPSGPRPSRDGEPVGFGSYKPTQHAYVTNTAVPLPDSADLFTVSGQILCEPLVDSYNYGTFGTLESVAQGWPADVRAVIIDKRPSQFGILHHHGDAMVILGTQNMETGQPVEQLRTWAMRVAERMSAAD